MSNSSNIISYNCINNFCRLYYLANLKRSIKILLSIIVIASVLCLIRIKPKVFVYGWFAGECKGSCGIMYQVTEKHICKDTTSYWINSNTNEPLRLQAQVAIENDHEGDFNNFKLNIPLVMMIDPRKQFGCPDCADQGGYYLQYTMLGITKNCRIDKGHEPFYYKSIVKDLDSLINKTLFEFEQNPDKY